MGGQSGMTLVAAADPEFRVDPDRHEYWHGTARLPSVTETIAHLGDGLAGIPPAVLEHARQRGTAVHAAIQYHHEGDLVMESLDTEIVPYFEAWLRFVEETGFRVLGAEQPMMSRTYRYAGTPDAWGEMGGDLWLPDLKTTATMAPKVAVQTSAYQRLLHENTNRKARRAGLQLRADGTYRFHPYAPADDARDFSVFMAALTVHNWRIRHD